MLVLRKGGQFTESQISRYLLIASLFFGLAISVLIVSWYIQAPLVGLVVAAIALSAFKAKFRRWENWTAGKRGELAVTESLRALSNEYVVLNDLVLPDGKGNIDHLVIGPNGLFAVETKNYSGRVKCLGDQWFVNGHRIKSLSRQSKSNALAVRNNLASIFAEHRTKSPYIVSLLVFVQRRRALNFENPTISVLESDELARFIQTYQPANHQECRNSELKRALVHHLHMLQRLPEQAR